MGFGEGLMWAIGGGSLPALMDLYDDLRHYGGSPIDWDHVITVAIGGIGSAAVMYVIKAITERRALYTPSPDAPEVGASGQT